MPHAENDNLEETPLFSEKCYRHRTSNVLYTEFVKSLIDVEPSDWLLDTIGNYQSNPEIQKFPHQSWSLTVDENKRATLVMKEDEELDSPIIVKEEIEFTNFPVDDVTFVFTDNILMGNLEYALDYRGEN